MLNPTEPKSHKHTHTHMWKTKGLQRRRLSHPHPSAAAVYADPCSSNTLCPIFFPVFALIDCPVEPGPNFQPEGKQTAAGQERLQEAICFYTVDMGRAGLFCWKWFSSSLSPWPWALSCPRAKGEAGGGGETRMRWQPDSQVAVAALPSPG